MRQKELRIGSITLFQTEKQRVTVGGVRDGLHPTKKIWDFFFFNLISDFARCGKRKGNKGKVLFPLAVVGRNLTSFFFFLILLMCYFQHLFRLSDVSHSHLYTSFDFLNKQTTTESSTLEKKIHWFFWILKE